MTQHSFAKIQDGDYEIVYSNIFNIYNKKLSLQEIGGFNINIEFIKTIESEKRNIEVKNGEDPSKKEINIKLTNFDNTLGVATTTLVPILDLVGGKKLYFSIHAKSLNKEIDFLQVSLTFYLR